MCFVNLEPLNRKGTYFNLKFKKYSKTLSITPHRHTIENNG